MKLTISIEDLRAAISYDPETGVLTWRIATSQMTPGSTAGADDGHGYIHIGFKGRKHRAHRIAWAVHYGRWPRGVIDHINGDGMDNRLSNLREATVAQNTRNQRRPRNNTTGYKGVRVLHSGRFAASIRVNGRQLSLGTFKTKFEAAVAYDAAAVAHYGEFAHVNVRKL